MLVTLEIPGVSLLTNLNLLAAQAGLQSVVTKSGAVLGMTARSDEDANQSATTVLSNETINHYLFRAQQMVKDRRLRETGAEYSLFETSLEEPEPSGSSGTNTITSFETIDARIHGNAMQ